MLVGVMMVNASETMEMDIAALALPVRSRKSILSLTAGVKCRGSGSAELELSSAPRWQLERRCIEREQKSPQQQNAKASAETGIFLLIQKHSRRQLCFKFNKAPNAEAADVVLNILNYFNTGFLYLIYQ